MEQVQSNEPISTKDNNRLKVGVSGVKKKKRKVLMHLLEKRRS